MTTFINNDVASGAIVKASDHNTQGALIAAVLNGGIDGNNIAPNAVGSTEIADFTVTNSKLATTTGEVGGSWQTYVPAVTRFNTGLATLNYAKYKRVGKDIEFRISYTLTGAAITGSEPRVSLPVTAAVYTAYSQIGSVVLNDTGTNTAYGPLLLPNTTEMAVYAFASSGSFVSLATVSATLPHTWAATDTILIHGSYEAAN